MSSETAAPALPAGSVDESAKGAGLLMLGLAQMVCIFAVWLALWPAAFGLSRGAQVGLWLGLAFGASGVLGFYLAVRALSVGGQA